jgi:transposase
VNMTKKDTWKKLGVDSATISSDRLNNQGTPSNPEVVEQPKRRRYTAEYKQRILQEADQCALGELGALLRREGLYSSHLTKWRRQRAEAEREALAPKKRGRKATVPNPLSKRMAELERENARLQRRVQQAEAVIEVQKKISEILQIPLTHPDPDERD